MTKPIINKKLAPMAFTESLFSATEKPDASAFLWNKKMMLNMNCRGYANAQFMQPEPSKYAFAPSLEAKTFMQPEHPYFAHHPGRYFYIRDEESGELFSLPFAPCNIEAEQFEFVANNKQVTWHIRHMRLQIELRLCLAIDDPFEYWKVSIEDVNNQPRQLSVISYFPLGYMSWMNQSANYDARSHSIVAKYVTPYQKLADYPALKKTAQMTIFASDRKPDSWCAKQSAFEGFGGLMQPEALNKSLLPNEAAFYETPCAASHFRMALSGSTENLHCVFGPMHNEEEAVALKTKHIEACISAFSSANQTTESSDFPFQVISADTQFDSFINQWLPRQVFYHGDVNRLTTDPQTRNYIQDNIGMCFLRPSSARECLLTALTQQHRSGEMPDGILIHPDAELKYINEIPHSDHCIWLPLLLEVYLDQTNDVALLHESVCFNDSTEEKSVIEHIELALNWVLAKRDERGLCFIEQGDWCDPMNMVGPKGKGVSVWLTLALTYAIKVWLRIAKHYKLDVSVVALESQLLSLRNTVIKHCWDGNWFARGITDNNELFGVDEDVEGRIFLNPQTWALLAGIDEEPYKSKILRAVDEHLQTPYGNQMLAPCYTKMDERVGRVTQKFPGSAENGSVYNHAFAFWIFAMFECGEAEKGFLNLKEMLNAAHSEQAGQMPIYLPNYFRGAYKQFPETAGKSSHLFNTGTAAWVYRTVIQQVFGLQGKANRLIIEPSKLPSLGDCDLFYRFRDATFTIKINYVSALLKQETYVDSVLLAQNAIDDIVAGKHYSVQIKLPKQDKSKAARLVIVCGVSGSGKSTVASRLASHMNAMFIEGDDLHSRAAKDKMAQGIALSEADREPWVQRLFESAQQKLAHGYDTVLCFSGLSKKHRQRLMSLGANACLLMLNPPKKELEKRLKARKAHFFAPSLLQSQLDSMEPLSHDETNTVLIDNDVLKSYSLSSGKGMAHLSLENTVECALNSLTNEPIVKALN
ncbi:AAA family ATPase [Glaciecola sp. MH2013]|uniref:gluconokinase, GntK/IdnK-type n=1 Tax=Glaciecola sp. MH2013 TaxID=2785524 RepID=UPI0018A01A4F|nr:gluconokinase, GntK/IdnK-type [Glaciecola sp. MH2013]MBF7073048.1 AAA family ATPase [Glaciecola sp. MH2013]